jgi:hypothetical protein
MSGHGQKMTRRQEKAIAALLAAATIEEAAARVGVGPATLRRWRNLPSFDHAYRLARQEILDATVSRLVNAATKAVDKLERLLTNRNPALQLRAAVAILDRAVRGVQLCDFEYRIKRLEQPSTECGRHAPFAERNNGQT